jgi:hypothetical protein
MGARLSSALSLTAIAVAIGGTTPIGRAALAQVLPPNSVGTAELKNSAVTNAKLGKNVVTSSKVKDRSLLAVDFAAGQLPSGPKGDKGDKGDPATSLWASINSNGSVRVARGVTSASQIATGAYTVVFNQNVSNCALIATQNFLGNAYAAAHYAANNANAVTVSLWATPNFGFAEPTNGSFSVAVFC